ncbi:MAG: DM13 domain-containing protein [Candidatus Zambryskibacteria bacterium]|nr:DM13 domain-containing protein [Candidatus Zambryskibacteria bacterium]
MKKIIVSIVVLAALGFGYWTISPLFIDKKVSEEFPVQEAGTLSGEVLAGAFIGFDSIHYGSGDVKVIKTEEGYIIRFEENFNVANGPDLYVGLGKDGEYKGESQIAKLKGNIGSQNYVVPEDINLENYNEVWVWCRAFSVGFAKAILNPSI